MQRRDQTEGYARSLMIMQLNFFRTFLLILFFCSLLTACSLHKLNMQKGMYDFKLNAYRDAFIRLQPEAEHGNKDAQYAIGYMYYYGKGVYEDRDRAKYWIQRAASQGQPLAIVAMDAIAHNPA